MEVRITDIETTKITGVQVHMEKNGTLCEERYFVWKESPLIAQFQSPNISGGVIDAWHHSLVFSEIEYHKDQEMFYFTKGTAIMIFADTDGESVNMDSIQAVRIPQGTQLIIEKGKGHFVAIAEGHEPVSMVVVAPKMEAPRVTLKETVRAVERGNQ